MGEFRQTVKDMMTSVEGVVLDKPHVVRASLAAFLAGGHVLLEDVPGVAKTMLVRALAASSGCTFTRIQCTPDLLPSDVSGVSIFNQDTRHFEFRRGPIFSQIVVADEINRATPRTQSALLEAMAEGQVSVDGATYTLEKPFAVFATQNPVEHEGTFPLPEAQLDRFLLHLRVGYPDEAAETQILHLVRSEVDRTAAPAAPPLRLTEADLLAARRALQDMHMAEPVERYLVGLVMATREARGVLHEWIEYGASPRGTIALDQAARAVAWLDGRQWVTPEDVQSVAHDALRHRLILTFDAQAQGITTDRAIDRLLEQVPVP